jgi:plastocyanin
MPTAVRPSRTRPAHSPLLTVAAAARPATTTVTVDIARFTFTPDVVEVSAGTTVTWLNHDESPHTATAEDGAFDTGSLAQGGRGSVTFDTPGTHHYACAWNPGITGTIIVTAAS